MTATRRKPTYGRYRFNGHGRDALSRTRQGEAIEYDVVDRGDALEVAARATRQNVTLCARIDVAGAKTSAVRCTLVQESGAPESLLDVRVAMYSTALAMHWDWVETIEIDMPAIFASALVHSMQCRKHLKYLGRVVTSVERRLLRFRNLP